MFSTPIELPSTLCLRNEKIPEAFRRAATGDLTALGPSSEFTLDGGGHALLYPERSDEVALTATPYRAAVVTMVHQQYPRPGYCGINEKGRSMAFFHLDGEFIVTVDGRSFPLTPGAPVVTRDRNRISIFGTGKLFILADGGETNEYPE